MRNDIELEEGEAYFSEDDDEKLYPDKDFSYIDWKVDDLLGQYRNDFTHGYSAECRGPRYGDYGSFLPMYERSPPLLPVLRSQNHSSLKSLPIVPSKHFSENHTVAANTSPPVKTVSVPHVQTEKCTLELSSPFLPVLRCQSHSSLKFPTNLPSKHFSENHTVAANTSPPVKIVPVPHGQTEKCTLGLGICNVNSQSEVKNSAECASNQRQQPKKPIIHQSAQNSLKFKVKIASESVLSPDNTAIYSGLGLDMSPASSPEGTPLEFDRSLPDFQQFELQSPSFIIEIMTSMPFPNDALISPLHDDLMSLMKMDKSLETSLSGLGQAESLNIMYDNAYLQGKKEAGDERKPNLNHTRNEKNSKENEAMQVRKPRQYLKNEKPAELVKEDGEFLSNSSDFGAIGREEIGTLVGKKKISNTSINAVDAHSKEAGMFSDSRPSVVFHNKSEVGCVADEMNNYTKHGQMGGQKVKDEFALVSSDATAVEEGNGSKIRTKSKNGESKITFPKAEPATDKKNEFGHRKDEANSFLNIMKEDSDSGCPKEADDYRKERVKQEKIAKDKEVGLLSGKDIKASNKHVDIHQELKHHDSEYFESSKHKSNIKAMPHVQMGLSLEEPSSSLVKKKLNDRQTGFVSSADPLIASIVRSSDPKVEDVHRNILAKSKRGDVDLPKGMRKDSDGAVIESPNKKGKEVSSRALVMGPSVRDARPPASKMKELLSSKNTGAVNNGANLEGDLTGGNWLRGRVPVGDFLPPANGFLGPLEMDDWVQCEKCEKWRLLPFGTNPNSLSKKWICSMLNWLPGMNKCSVSEDETTRALRSLYVPSVSGPALQVQNYQRAHLDEIASSKASSGTHNVGLSNLVSSSDVLLSSGKNKNPTKLQVDAVVQSGAQDLYRPIKNDPPYSGEIRNPKNLKKLPLESACAAAGKPSKIPTKRMAETEVSGVPKKMKNVHQQSIEKPIVIGMLSSEAKGGNQNYHLDAFRNSRDVMPRSSKCVAPTVINRGRSMMSAMDNKVNDISEKKRKLTDQQQSVVGSASFSNSQQPLNNLVTGKNSGTEPRKETKTNTSNIEARDSSADQRDNKTRGNNLDGVGDSQRKVSMVGRNTLDPYHGHQLSQKTADARKYSEKNLDLSLSDNATTSSSSKISINVQAEASKLKFSPAGSISSSPLKVCMSGPDKGTNKVVVSCNEPEELSSRKRLNSSGEGAYASHGLASHNGEINGRKSNFFRISGVMSDAAQEDHFSKKVSSGRQTSAHSIDSQHKLEVINCRGKFDRSHHEGGTVALQQSSENQISNGLHFNGTSSERQKLLPPDMSGIKELSNYANHASDFEKGSGSNSVIAANGTGNLSRPVLVDHVSLRHPHQATYASKDIEAKTALKEANDLKHSASRLKTSGSRLSTGIFFQASLKFLHGASLLELGTIENGRNGEMMSTEVYSSSAKLCEYCAHEYERRNDMASAALAYKCMEVAYMRLIYYNNAAATRDRLELQMALRVTQESPSSSASDIDNLNNQLAIDSVRGGHALMVHRSRVVSARNRPNLIRLLSFMHNINLAMVASSKSQSAFAVANPILSQERNERGISCIKRVLDFSFHDVEGLLHLVRLAIEALNN